MKSLALASFLLLGVHAAHVQAENLIEEIVAGSEFAAVYNLADKESGKTGPMVQSLLIPAIFQFDKTSVSIGMSMAGAAMKNHLKDWGAGDVVAEASPIILNGGLHLFGKGAAARLTGEANANFFKNKALYGTGDFVLKVSGSHLVSAGIFAGAGVALAIYGFEPLSKLMFENAGVLLGDWMYSLSESQFAVATTSLAILSMGSRAPFVLGANNKYFTALLSGYFLATFTSVFGAVA